MYVVNETKRRIAQINMANFHAAEQKSIHNLSK